MTEFVLDAEEIHKSFDELQILKGASLKIRPAESIAIMGRSGEGKSTLLHILGTLELPSKGNLKIMGEVPTKTNLFYLRNQHVGFIFQAYHLLEDFTVLENVLMPMRIGRSVPQEEWGRQLLAEVGLTGKEGVLAKFLSGGEKQRLAIARALCNKPALLLADEPTGNLDKAHSEMIQKLLLEKAKQFGAALIVVTHDPEFASLCDRTLLLKEGQLYNR